MAEITDVELVTIKRVMDIVYELEAELKTIQNEDQYDRTYRYVNSRCNIDLPYRSPVIKVKK